MSYNTFSLALKSTIDYQAKLLADTKSLPFIDLAAESFDVDILESDQPAVVWEFASVTEDPMDPLYLVLFDIGVMTMADPSQYISLDYVSMFLDAFRAGRSFQIMDYSGDDAPTQVVGSLFIVSSAITPQQADRVAGLRFITVTARAARNV